MGNSRISKSEAAQLPNKTIAAVAGEDDYLVVISVFHDLHCLVILSSFSFLNTHSLKCFFPETRPYRFS